LLAYYLFIDDLKFVDSLLAKDSESWDRLMREHVPFLNALASQTGLGDEDARDCVQDALASLWDNDAHALREYKGRSTFKTYLARIVHRDCLDFIRREKSQMRKVERKSFAYLMGGSSKGDKAVAEKLDVEALVDKLDAKGRLLVKLIYYDGLTSEEVGEIFGASASTVDVWHFRLREKLRRLAGADKGGPLKKKGGEKR
jgi:RNA polymerase sigma factor (sigma-70 family)